VQAHGHCRQQHCAMKESYHALTFVGNLVVLVLQVKLACARFLSEFNVVIGNEVVLVLEGKLVRGSFP